MHERFLPVKQAMKEALKGEISCGTCTEPIHGPKVTMIETTVPRNGEAPQVAVIFMHRSCIEGGDFFCD